MIENVKQKLDQEVKATVERWRNLQQAEDLAGEPVDLEPYSLKDSTKTKSALEEADHSYRAARTLLDKLPQWLESLVLEVKGSDVIDQAGKSELVERLRREYMQAAHDHVKAAREKLTAVVAEQEAVIQGAAVQPERLEPMAEVAQRLRLGELVEDLTTDFRLMMHPDQILAETRDRLAAAFAAGKVAEAAAVRRAARRALSVSDSPAARPALQAIEREHAAALKDHNDKNEGPEAEPARRVIEAAREVYRHHDRQGGFSMAQQLENAGHPIGRWVGPGV